MNFNISYFMNELYQIDDSRNTQDFKMKTFSGFKKTDVMNAVLKSIETKKIENACYWASECIVSGYVLALWEKLIVFSSKIVHINNPNLPVYLLRKNKVLFNQVTRIHSKSKENELLLRNSQMIRNLFFDVISTLTTSSKTKRYDKYPKLNDKEDFDFGNIQKRLFAQMNILPPNMIHFNDPDELRIIMNEIFTLLKNQQFGYDKCIYWVMWLFRWEALHKKKKTPWLVDERNVSGISKKLQANVIWVIWDVIYEEVNHRKDEKIKEQVDALYELYKWNYSIGKRNTRLPLLFNAIGYLTHSIQFKFPVRMNYKIFIQVQCNVNKMFSSKKVHEIKKEKILEKTPPKKENIQVEIVQDKISIFNEVDALSLTRT